VQDVATRVQGIFSTSENGVLAYAEAAQSGDRQLVWLDRNGKQVGAVAGTDAYSDPHISPDGKRLAFSLESPSFDVWVYDVMRGVKTRFTFSSALGTGNLAHLWSPDGRHIAYTSIRSGKFGIYQKAADGSGGEETLLEPTPEQVYPEDWSPDGKLIAYWKSQAGGAEIWILPLQGDHKPYPFLQSQSLQTTAFFSPDGKWIAYGSNESGRLEVYIRPFPGPGGKWQVSTEGGWYPHWRRDGRELFYVSADSRLMSAEVKTNGTSLEIGAVRPLFETRPYYGLFSGNVYDVTADGQRFIVAYEPQQSNSAITLVVNWLADLRK
jgi:Tol biopolymer transport system component